MPERTRKLLRPAEETKDSLQNFALSRAWQVSETKLANGTKLTFEAADGKCSLNIYHSKARGITSIVYDQPTGRYADVLDAYLEGQSSLVGSESGQAESRWAVYRRLSADRLKLITEALNNVGAERTDVSRAGEMVGLRLTRTTDALRVTVYETGTVVLQGRNTALFDEVCSLVETLGESGVNEIAVRFVTQSSDEAERLAALLSPKLMLDADEELKSSLGESYHYLAQHDRKYLQSSLCLLSAGLDLPEYSCLVMPASKGLEGFCKKLMVSLGIVTEEEVRAAGFSWGAIRDKPNYAEARKDKDSRVFLDKMAAELEFSRNFMLHSSDKPYMQVATSTDARKDVDRILDAVRDIFAFFQPRL